MVSFTNTLACGVTLTELNTRCTNTLENSKPQKEKLLCGAPIHPTSGPGSLATGSDVETLTGCLSPRHSTLVFLNSATSTLLIPLSFYNKVSYLISTY